MKSIKYFSFFVFFLSNLELLAQVDTAWVRRYKDQEMVLIRPKP